VKDDTSKGRSASNATWATLESYARDRVQWFIQQLLEEELTDLLGRGKSERRATVDAAPGYRNGHGRPRKLAMQTGTIEIRRPRARGLEQRFESRVLPLFERRTTEVGKVLPELYLHGLSTGDFELALRGLLGDAAPLSASSIERLKSKWLVEFDAWRRRSLEGREVVYAWADGIYVKAGLEQEKAALLVIIGALRDGRKEVLALAAGHRESKESWAELLRDLKTRGLDSPKVLVADGNAGVWAAAAEVWPDTAEQRCWNHKIGNVIDKLPKKLQAEASVLLKKIPYAPSEAEARRLREAFNGRYRGRHPEAAATLEKDWPQLTAFYNFPAEHWVHLRTTNIVESPFAAVRLRTGAAKRFKKVPNATALIWKLLQVAESRMRRLTAADLLAAVYDGRCFKDGVLVVKSGRKAAA
jgi:transposase-like protein